jgi:DNA-binding IclR family transcriptional regulator
MPRPSPQTDRIRWTLNLLARDPRRAHNLAQIARHLGVSKATCLPMVSALTEAGWLVRHPVDKTYRLGPALVALGHAAERSESLTEIVLPRLVELSAKAPGMTGISWLCSGDQLVLGEIADAKGPRPDWDGLKRGLRLRPHPPLASCLVAWADEADVTAWLLRSRPTDLEAARSHYAPALAATRERGFVVELAHPLVSQVFVLVQRIASEHPGQMDDLVRVVSHAVNQELQELEIVVADIDPDRMYKPVSINAPVFDAVGSIELIVCMTNAPAPMFGTEVQRVGELVRALAAELTERVGGTWPRLPA